MVHTDQPLAGPAGARAGSASAGGTPVETDRYVEEPAKDAVSGQVNALRTEYQRDRARVLHSAAFRRLAAKTQVHTVGGDDPWHALAGERPGDDFLRTRLTHSLEVAQIAREMGGLLGCDPDLVDTAGLAHDLGHPPFGHNGEDALNEVASPCGGFEGNAQTLRVLTRLEAKVVGPDGASVGLNLTRASLDACCKYPWFRPADPAMRKFGVYADDAAIFSWLRAGVPVPAAHAYPPGAPGAPHQGGTGPDVAPQKGGTGEPEPPPRCLEAQVMDWADDVAYSVHDMEDGVHGGYVLFSKLRAAAEERVALCADVAATYSAESVGDLGAVLGDLLDDPLFEPLYRYDGGLAAMVGLKRVTSVLTGRLVSAAVTATRTHFGDGALRGYAAELVVPRRTRAECALLKGIALRYVMRRPGAASRYERQREILTSLVRVLSSRAPDGLDRVFAPLWRAAPDDAARLRVVIDQVASLTDPGALAWYGRLVVP